MAADRGSRHGEAPADREKKEKEIRNLPRGHENRRSVCSTAANENLGRHTDSEMELTSPIRINWKAEPWA